jgi:hypothetical protein
MKKIILALTICVSLNTLAQNSKEELLTKMSNEACVAFEKVDITSLNKDNYQQELSLILIPIMSDNMDAIKKYYDIETPTEENFRKIGMDLGMKLAATCKKFMEFSISIAQESLSKKTPVPAKKEKLQTTELTATLTAYTPADIAFITVKDAKGKMQKLYWMEYFENADNFMANMKKYIGKKITITYAERDVFDAAKKTYKSIKVIAGIELL